MGRRHETDRGEQQENKGNPAGSPRAVISSGINIGNVLCDLMGDLDGALESYEGALALAREIGDRGMQCGLLHNLGSLDLDRGEYESAVARFDDVQDMAEDVGFDFLRFLGLRNQTACYVRLGRIKRALQTIGTCLEEGEGILEPLNRVALRLLVFEAYLSALAYERAEAALKEARELAESLSVTEQEDWLQLSEGRWLSARGDWDAAAKAFAGAAETAQSFSKRGTRR